MKIAIVCVIYFKNDSSLETAKQSLKTFISSKHDLDFIALINHIRDENDLNWVKENFNYYEDNGINILARAWNKGIKKAFERGADYVVCPNLDVFARPDSIDNLVEFAEKHKEALIWTATDTFNKESLENIPLEDSYDNWPFFSFYMIDKRLFQEVGEFDEGFIPAYFEDTDMRRRVLLKGYKCINSKMSYVYHEANVTIRSSKLSKLKYLFVGHPKNKRRYIKKWGGEPDHEKFTIPFNGRA